MKSLLTATLICAATSAAAADPIVSYPYSGSFEDATFGVESAIVDRGLVIDYTSHVGDMLARTGSDVGSDTQLFAAATVYLFCSAVLSRKVMEADPMNIGFCPYGIFVADSGDGVSIGYRAMPDGAMQEVQSLLDDIAREAAEAE